MSKKEDIKIKIGVQKQANKPIFLHKNGVVVCGNFTYKGRYKKKFREYYYFIKSHANSKAKKGVLDVSGYKYWDALSIYDYVAMRWHRSISLRPLEKLANETEIRMRVEVIRKEFVRAARLKWLRIFRNSDPSDPHTPKMVWQIL